MTQLDAPPNQIVGWDPRACEGLMGLFTEHPKFLEDDPDASNLIKEWAFSNRSWEASTKKS